MRGRARTVTVWSGAKGDARQPECLPEARVVPCRSRCRPRGPVGSFR